MLLQVAEQLTNNTASGADAVKRLPLCVLIMLTTYLKYGNEDRILQMLESA